MTLKEKLAALKAEADQLRTKAQSTPDDFTDADAERTAEVVKAIDETQAKIDRVTKSTQALGGVANTPADPDQETDNPGGDAVTKGRSLGERFVKSDSYRDLRKNHPKGITKGTPIQLEAKNLVAKVLDTESAGHDSSRRVDEVDDLVNRPQRRFLDLITTGTTSIPWWKYRQVVAKQNNARIVPESTGTSGSTSLKPVSGLTIVNAEAKEFTYADGMEVTTQELTDDGIITTLIDTTLTENLEIEKERVLLQGSGTTGGEGDEGEPVGLFNLSGVLQQDYDTDIFRSIRKSITLLRKNSTNIQAVLLNPEDNEEWDLAQDSQGRFMGNGPFGSGPGTAWGYQRVESQSVPVGTAVVGDFSTIHLLTYQALAIEAFNQHKDFAQRNLVYVRAEERAAQLFRNPARLCLVDLNAGSSE